MNTRLHQIVTYKTDGKQADFAAFMGWSPQYLGKLLKGEGFGLNPVLSLLAALPEIDARWLLFGEGEMLTANGVASVRNGVMGRVQSLLEYEKYIPVMTAEELKQIERAIKKGSPIEYSPDTLASLADRLQAQQDEVNNRIKAAMKKSLKPCRPKTVKK